MIGREEERLKLLMEEYQKTLSMLDQTHFDDVDGPTTTINKTYRVEIPFAKKVLVLPVIEELLGRVDFYIEEKDRNYYEAKRQTERLR
jgi:hypothetical protein